MQHVLGHRFSDVLGSLSRIFTVQPSSNYGELLSRSSKEVELKAWVKTVEQMRSAIQSFERVNPQTVEMAQAFSKLTQEQVHAHEKYRAIAGRIEELERASRKFEQRIEQIDRLRESRFCVEHDQKRGDSSR